MRAKNELSQVFGWMNLIKMREFLTNVGPKLDTRDMTALNRALLSCPPTIRRLQKQGGAAQGALWWAQREVRCILQWLFFFFAFANINICIG